MADFVISLQDSVDTSKVVELQIGNYIKGNPGTQGIQGPVGDVTPEATAAKNDAQTAANNAANSASSASASAVSAADAANTAAAAVMAPIANATATDAGTLTGAEYATVSRGSGVLKTTLTAIAQWVLQTYQGFTQSGTGAVARTVQAKLREFRSAEDHGAVGDGVTSDTTAIGNGVSALQRGALRLPSGPYNFTLSLSGNKGVQSYTEGASQDVWYWGRDYSGVKSAGAGVANLGLGPAGFQFDIRNDVADAGGDFVRTLFGRTVFGTSAAKGGRIGVLGEALHNLGPTNSASTNRNYVGVVGTAHSELGDGGTNTGAGSKGAYFGINGIAQLAATATNVFSAAGCELNVYAKAGASSKYVFGATIAGFSEIFGSTATAALEIGGGTDNGFGPHVGWNHGILFSNIHGGDPTNSNSILIGTYWSDATPRTIQHGIDLSGFNITGAVIQGSKLSITENSILLGANGANVTAITAGNGVAAANFDLNAKGGGAVRLKDGNGVSRVQADQGIGVVLTPLASATPGTNGDLAIQATSNTSLTFKFKGSDGTVRSASLTLA